MQLAGDISRLGDGSHGFTVTATDAAGNAASRPSPGGSTRRRRRRRSRSTPSNPSNASSPTFAFGSNEQGVVYACRLEQGGFEACPAPKTYAGLVDGQHAFAVRAHRPRREHRGGSDLHLDDRHGQTDDDDHRQARQPEQQPLAELLFTASEDASFICRLDGSEAACTTPAGYGNLGDGPHTFGVRATDAAGNAGADGPQLDDRDARAHRCAHVGPGRPDQYQRGELCVLGRRACVVRLQG